MYISKVIIKNFRCIKNANITFPKQVVMIGDNNCGKSTILEAINLVMGPERMSRRPVVDEYDFYMGLYEQNDEPIEVYSEVIVTDLNDEQVRYFHNHIEWLNISTNELLDSPPVSGTDDEDVKPALRICFIGKYNNEEDDFEGGTYYCNPVLEDGRMDRFSNKDKRMCGFLYLRTLRTGTRALSLEHGSLLDVILSIKEIHPKMWEEVIKQLRDVAVATNPEIGISEILVSLQDKIHKFLPDDIANNPMLKVSNLTRENLRKSITVFVDSGMEGEDKKRFHLPYYKLGMGTINVLVLALLNIIADLKQNVIFAMEEPEISIPPYIQKSIILNVNKTTQQSIFTSHSPYVLEEFESQNVLILSNDNGNMSAITATLPPAVKLKTYREDLRKNFFESLLSSKVLITEGRTEYDVYYTMSRYLEMLDTKKYASFDRMGIALVNAGTDTQIALLGQYYKKLNKKVFAVFDKQEENEKMEIEQSVDKAYEAQEHGIEKVVLNNISIEALRRYGISLVSNGKWPKHLADCIPTEDSKDDDLKKIMFDYFKNKKGEGALADLLCQCTEDELPKFICETISDIKLQMTSIETESDDI